MREPVLVVTPVSQGPVYGGPIAIQSFGNSTRCILQISAERSACGSPGMMVARRSNSQKFLTHATAYTPPG